MTAKEVLQKIEKQREEAGIAFLGWIYLEVPEYWKVTESLEKQIPKKINEYNRCPCCDTYNEVIEKRKNTVKKDTCYCWHCGQAICFDDGERKENES